MELDFERCYRAVGSRDARFDGWFVTAVTSTGIYCRPSCPALTPKRGNVRFHATAAAAQRDGFRACKRCRPDATPGSPAWNVRGDVVARAMRLIADGVVDREGVIGLAARLGYTSRHLRRLITAELGVGPLALARAQRAQTARVLVETTDLPFGQVAFGAGFASIRQFNDTVREVFVATPSELRDAAIRRARKSPAGVARDPVGPQPGQPVTLSLRLAYRPPGDIDAAIAFLAARAVHGLEAVADGAYHRTLRLPHGHGTVVLSPADDHVRCVLALADLRDTQTAVARCRRLLDLDADPQAVAEHLGDDPLVGRLVRRRPGLRLVCGTDPVEAAMRVIVGQQVSVAGAAALSARLVEAHGDDTGWPGPVSRVFPTPQRLAAVDPAELPLPRTRARALHRVAGMLADEGLSLDPGTDRDDLSRRLAVVPGVGPWTVDLVRLRALGDTDVLPPGDLAVRRALAQLGAATDDAAMARMARRWRPWRSYVLQHLWSADAVRLSGRTRPGPVPSRGAGTATAERIGLQGALR